jgi:lipid A 3-O-deacylase
MSHSTIIKLILLFLFYFSFAIAQTDTLKTPINTIPAERYFKLNYDNDFFSATDRYYTQGIYMELIVPCIKKSPLSKLLISLDKKAINYYGLIAEQDVFTPRSIRHNEIYRTERPYSGVFMLSHTLVSIHTEKKQRLNTRIDIGIIGPEAMGKQEQKGIHHALKNIQPLGWEYQIARDYIINYDFKFEQGLITKHAFECIGYTAARVGTLYDDIGAGLLLRSGFMPSYFESLGLSKNKSTHFQAYLFSKGEVKAVGYNATLQGGMFNKNSVYTLASTDLNRVVATAYVGLVLAYKRVSLEYTKAYLSKEFKAGLPHGWGHITISLSF